jgi:hypothetical protein
MHGYFVCRKQTDGGVVDELELLVVAGLCWIFVRRNENGKYHA